MLKRAIMGIFITLFVPLKKTQIFFICVSNLTMNLVHVSGFHFMLNVIEHGSSYRSTASRLL